MQPKIETSAGGHYPGENPMLDSMDLSAIVDFEMNDNRKMHDTLLQDADFMGQMYGGNKMGSVAQQHMSAPKTIPKEPSRIQKYNHKGLNSLYWLKPQSKSIFLLDFKQQKFLREQIESQMVLPNNFTSCQITAGNIFVVGGILNGMVLKNTFELNESLQYRNVAVMTQARHSAPIILLKDRFILVAGGNTEIQSKKYTKSTEIYDI